MEDSTYEERYIDPCEFSKRGYLQEVNRLVLHPLGMALEVEVDEDGSSRFVGVWDYRDDPEGFYFTAGIDQEKAAAVEAERMRKAPIRRKALGYVIQGE